MGSDAGILSLGAVELRDRLKSGALRATELMHACLKRIAETDPQVQAFEWLDPAFALKQAEAADAHRAAGRPLGALHGLPVAVKDIIDTAGISTCNGTPIDAGRVPTRDAHVVQKLKAAGAIVIGKSVTTELAFLHPGKTRNPVNMAHTPGGSSSGSAAAVAAGMVPLAIGTQTGGSVIRPAAFCGVTGFLPSAGIDRTHRHHPAIADPGQGRGVRPQPGGRCPYRSRAFRPRPVGQGNFACPPSTSAGNCAFKAAGPPAICICTHALLGPGNTAMPAGNGRIGGCAG